MLDDTTIFFLDTFNSLGNYLGSVPRAGGETVRLVELSGYSGDLAASGAYLFYDGGDGRLMRVAKSGGQASVHVQFPEGVGQLFADGDYVYASSNGALYRVTSD